MSLKFWNFSLSRCACHLWKISFYPKQIFIMSLWTGSAKYPSRASHWTISLIHILLWCRVIRFLVRQQLCSGGGSAFGVLSTQDFSALNLLKTSNPEMREAVEEGNQELPNQCPVHFPVFPPPLMPSLEIVLNSLKTARLFWVRHTYLD